MAIDPISGLEIDPSTGLPIQQSGINPQVPNIPQQSNINPQVADYLKNKFNLGQFSQENRQQLVDQPALSTQDRFGAALAALGAGFSGQNAAAAGQSKLAAARDLQSQKVSQFDKARANAIQEQSLGREEQKYQKDVELQKRESDPNSEESKLAQTLGKKMAPSYDFSKLSAQQINERIPSLEKIYKIEQDKLNRQEALAAKKEAVSAKQAEGMTAGRIQTDKDFAKDYNEWTNTGAATVEKNLQKLREAKDLVQKDSFGTSGRLVGNLPNVLRSEQSKVIEQNVRSAAQGALKATLGSQFTEKEGERIMANAYDPTLSSEANITKIDAAIKEIEDRKNAMAGKVNQFEKTGSLKDYKFDSSKQSQSKSVVKKQYSPSANKTKVIYSDGSEEVLDGKQ